jgi:large subunit ribosomal protein L16
MVKKIYLANSKRRPFKLWVRNKRYEYNLFSPFEYIPHTINISYNLNFNSSFKHFLRPRRVVVKATCYAYLSANSIEAFRKALAPYFRGKKYSSSKLLIRVYSFLPLTKKPAEVRMGGGKGAKIRGFFSPVRPGQTLFEVLSRDPKKIKKLFLYASQKLSIPVKIFSLLSWLAFCQIIQSFGFWIIPELLKLNQLGFIVIVPVLSLIF